MAIQKNLNPRVAIYGVGQYGGHVARFAVQKGWPIVAAFNRAGDKVGRDLGQVIGLGRDLGVIIQDCDTADYSAVQADIGVVAQTNVLAVNFPAYERLMNAGMNVLCHGSQSYYPVANDPVTADKIDALAKAKGVTFTGGGIWDMSRIWAGILVAGPCTDIKSLFHTSITEAKGQAINRAQAEQVGIGMTLEEFDKSGLRESPLAISYRTIPQQVLHTLGFTISATRQYIEPVVFDIDLDCPWGGPVIPAGHCVGSRIIGEIETEQGVTARCEIDLRMFKAGEVEHMFWEVQGKPKTRVRTEREDSAHATASNLFNRIPDVIAAPPGIVMVSDMGPLKTSAVAV
jgi:secondary-alkyl amine dehydrogenase [NAD(P)+]